MQEQVARWPLSPEELLQFKYPNTIRCCPVCFSALIWRILPWAWMEYVYAVRDHDIGSPITPIEVASPFVCLECGAAGQVSYDLRHGRTYWISCTVTLDRVANFARHEWGVTVYDHLTDRLNERWPWKVQWWVAQVGILRKPEEPPGITDVLS